MRVWVEENAHGRLGLRVGYFPGKRKKRVAIDCAVNQHNRDLLEATAVLINDAIKRGLPVHDAFHEVYGSCPVILEPEDPQSPRIPADVTIHEYYRDYWISSQVAPFVRERLASEFRWSFERHILPHIGHIRLRDLSRRDLEHLRTTLLAEDLEPKGKRSIGAVRYYLTFHLKRLCKDAMADGVLQHDPFIALRWPTIVKKRKIDPFEFDERDRIIEWFRQHETSEEFIYVYSHFWSGIRPAESRAFRRGDVVLTGRGALSVEKSRVNGVDGPPKTTASARDVTPLLPCLLEELRKFAGPEGATEDSFFFTVDGGQPRNRDHAPRKWDRCLKELGIRRRSFYSTRHTFISWALTVGWHLVELAQYAGTSVRMIERHYARFIRKELPGADDHGKN